MLKLPKKSDLVTICEIRLNNKLSCRNCSESEDCKKFIKKHGNNPLQDYNIKIAEYYKQMEENENGN